MRWALACLVVAACTEEQPPEAVVPATVVHVEVSGACDGTCESVYYPDYCSYIPLIGADTRDVVAGSYWNPDDLTALVQLQYSGTWGSVDGSPGQLDYTLVEGDSVDVHSIYGRSYDEAWLFYRIDSLGHIVDIDRTHLISASDNTLVFEYSGLREIHTIDKPRPLNVQTQDPCVCCSAGRPLELGVIFALVLFPLRRRRRRCAAAALLVSIAAAGCGVTDKADVTTTVVEVHLTPACTDPSTCYETIDLYPYCGDELPYLDDETREVTAITVADPDEITGAFQLQYSGAVSIADSGRPHVDAVLTNGESEGVWAAYTDYDEPPLYDLDGEGHASNVDQTKLESVTGSTLRFVYRGAVEEHTVQPPRKITVETEDPPPCCSAGRPIDLGVVFALVLIPWRRRRKLRA